MNEEGMQDTPNKLIHIGKPIEFDMERFEGQLEELYVTANEDGDGIRADCDHIPSQKYIGLYAVRNRALPV